MSSSAGLLTLLIGCQAAKDHPLQPQVNKHAQQLKCHHLLCNMVYVCVHIGLLACKCDQMCACACRCLCVWICVCVLDTVLRFLCCRLDFNKWFGGQKINKYVPRQGIMESTTCLWMCLKTAPLSSLSTPHYRHTTDAFTTQTHMWCLCSCC